jgi:N-acetylglucosamine-6-phosphate deacetylase
MSMNVIKALSPGARPIEIHLDGEFISKVVTYESVSGKQQLSCDQLRAAPGFIDLQVNGFSGIDFNQADCKGDDLLDACRNQLETGVTAFCPTLITADYNRLARNITEIRKAWERHSLVRSMVLGIHLEGPYINPEDGPRGAHPKVYACHPDWSKFEWLLERGQGLVRMVTLAPELPGSLRFIKKASQNGLAVGIGHCAPEPEVVDQAVAAGAGISTHLGNGTHQMLDRHKNYFQKQLAHDGLMASLICDGIHLPDYFVKNVVRAKGRSKVVLITDATAASHARPGCYTLGDLEVEADDDGALKLAGTPYLTGSTLTMDRAIGNCAEFAEIPLAAAIKMATVNPAKLFPGAGGRLAQGRRADIVLFRAKGKQIKIERVYLGGRLVFSAEEDTKKV